MEQEYTVSTGMKILYGIVGLGIFIFAGYIFTIPKAAGVSPVVYFIPIAILTVGVMIFVNMLRRKVSIYNNHIINTGLFSTTDLAIEDIKGYRLVQTKNGGSLIFEPLSPHKSRLRIGNYTDLKDSDELRKWVQDNFKDLDAVDLRSEEEKFLSDSSLGASEDERKESLKKYKDWYISYNIVGVVFSLITIPFNSKARIIIVSLYALAGIPLMLFSKGTIKFVSETKRSLQGFIFVGFLAPSMVLFIKGLASQEIASLTNFWPPFIAIAVVLSAILFATGINRVVGKVGGQIFMMLLTSALFSAGSVLEVNCVFDQSTPKLFHTTITDKFIQHNKGIHYYIKVAKWDSNYKPSDISVSGTAYHNYSLGDTVGILMKQGRLNIPWYKLAK